MNSSDAPSRIQVPFAQSGTRTTIPVPSQSGITAGAASYTDGFPPLTRTPPGAGGIPPDGREMNGILFALSSAAWWAQAGGAAKFDAAHAAAIGGYPAGAVLQSSDGSGWWCSTADANATDPEGGSPAGWVPHPGYGVTAVTMTGSNVTLTLLQALRPQIVITGALSANVNLVLPAGYQTWLIRNSTTGAYKITAKTAAGSGEALLPGPNLVCGDGANIQVIAGAYGQVLAATGYKMHPGGFAEAWGSTTIPGGSNSGSAAITFPAGLFTAVYGIDGAPDLNADSGWNPTILRFPSLTTAGVTMVADTGNAGVNFNAGISVRWKAWGKWN